MKIQKLISVFERLLPVYEAAHRRKRLTYITANGICWAAQESGFGVLDQVMDCQKGYYKNLLTTEIYGLNQLLFPYPKTYKDLKPRIDFLKSEIKDLNQLIKKGYTHV